MSLLKTITAKKNKLKRRSTGKQPPETLIFFLDRSLGRKHVAQALRDAGEQVELHDDHFSQDTLDEEWLTHVGAKGWIVLTNDGRIRNRKLEKQALHDAQVAAFIRTSMNLKGQEMAEAFLKALKKIKSFVHKHPKPFIALVTRSGDVRMHPYDIEPEQSPD